MDQVELKSLLDELIARWESEVVEFKLASRMIILKARKRPAVITIRSWPKPWRN